MALPLTAISLSAPAATLKYDACNDPQSDAEKQKVCEFLENVRANVNRSHKFFNDFNPEDAGSIAKIKARIASVAGVSKAEEVLVKYIITYQQEVALNWETVFTFRNIGEAFMKNEARDSRLWRAGKILEQEAYTFLEDRDNREQCPDKVFECDDLYEDMEKRSLVAKHMTLPDKVVPRLKQRGVTYTISAIFRNVKQEIGDKITFKGKDGIGEKYLKGKLELSQMAGALPGFKVIEPLIEGDGMGTLIIGDPREGARVGLGIKPKGSVSVAGIEKQYEGRLQSRNVVTMQSDTGMPLGTVVVDGHIEQDRFDSRRIHGIVVRFPDGSMRIIDKRRFLLSDITDKESDRAVILSIGDPGAHDKLLEALAKRKATVLQGPSFEPLGDIVGREKWREYNGDSQRRMVFTFKDGKFGMFNSNDHSTNEMLAVLYRLEGQFGPLERVVLCDRGMWDSAAWYKNGRPEERVPLANSADPSNMMFFYTESLAVKKGAKSNHGGSN